MQKKLIVLTIILSVFFVCINGAAEGSPEDAGKPLMLVDNAVSLTVSDFYDYLIRFENKFKFRPSIDKQKEILKLFANEELLYADAVKNGYDKNEDLKIKFEEAIKKGYGSNLTLPKQKEWLKKRFIVEHYLNDFISKNAAVSDNEALEHYEKNKQKYLVPDRFTGFFYTVQPVKNVDEKAAEAIVEKVKAMIVENKYTPIDYVVMHNLNQDNPDFNVVIYKVKDYQPEDKKKGISIPSEAVKDFMKLSPKSLTVTKVGNDSIISVLTEKSEQHVMPFADAKNRIVSELNKAKKDAALKDLMNSLEKRYSLTINYDLLK